MKSVDFEWIFVLETDLEWLPMFNFKENDQLLKEGRGKREGKLLYFAVVK